MRQVIVYPKDRSLTKRMYKYIDGMARKTAAQALPEIEKAALDSLIYGSGYVQINTDLSVSHVPLPEILKDENPQT